MARLWLCVRVHSPARVRLVGALSTPLDQLWDIQTHLRPPGETSQPGTKRTSWAVEICPAQFPLPWGAVPGKINVIPCLWTIPHIFSSPELSVCVIQDSVILSPLLKGPETMAPMGTQQLHYRKSKNFRERVALWCTIPTWNISIHVPISINTPISPYGWVYIYMYQSQNTSKFLLAPSADGVTMTDEVLWSL